MKKFFQRIVDWFRSIRSSKRADLTPVKLEISEFVDAAPMPLETQEEKLVAPTSKFVGPKPRTAKGRSKKRPRYGRVA